MKTGIRIIIPFAGLIVCCSAFIFAYLSAAEPKRPFVVVLDPGHGGKNLTPKEIYGDKYSPLDDRYEDVFRSGTSAWGLQEHEEAFDITVEVKKILELTATDEGMKKFRRMVAKYAPNIPAPDRAIEVHISREAGYHQIYEKIKDDINGPYRMFDYPDVRSRELQPGRLSRINSLQPHLVVSVHLNGGKAPANGAMGAVITPSYNTFKMALDYVSGSVEKRRQIERQFLAGHYAKWMDSCGPRSSFQQFLCDAWIYFNGYWPQQGGLKPDLKIFRGFRHNLVSWKYRDDGDWISEAKKRTPGTRYSSDLGRFKPEGKFWDRERSPHEIRKREGGPEGFGGDNYFASLEILRYIRKGLLVNGVDTEKTLPAIEAPYLSTWTVPTYINAVNAYLEIAYLNNRKDYNRILRHSRVYAESIAVGIYSLLYSLPVKGGRNERDPRGKKLDFNAYGNYFRDT